MNFLRGMFLLLTITAVSMCASPSFAQQEVDPDHYDQPIVANATTKAGASKHAAAKSTHAKTNVAKRQTRHQSHPSA